MRKLVNLITLLLLVSIVDLSAQSVEVFFNHIWIAIDSKDFEAINSSDFIHSEFSANDKHTSKTESGDEWSGIYFYGENNYVEFLDEKAQHIKAGSSGIGFSVEQSGQLKQIKKELQKTFGKHVHAQKQTKLEGDKHIKWYQSLFVNDEVHLEDTALYYWVLEYEKDIFIHKGIELDADNNLTKAKYLSPWENERKGKYFKGVTGLTIDLHHDEYKTFSKFLLTVGFKKSGDNVYKGPKGFEIILEELDVNTPTVTSIRMDLQKSPSEDKTMEFGSNTTLKLNSDGSGEWIFK